MAACESMATDQGSVGGVSNSCKGDLACIYAGEDYGLVEGIVDSCMGESSCSSIATSAYTTGSPSVGAFGKYISQIVNGCNAKSVSNEWNCLHISLFA